MDDIIESVNEGLGGEDLIDSLVALDDISDEKTPAEEVAEPVAVPSENTEGGEGDNQEDTADSAEAVAEDAAELAGTAAPNFWTAEEKAVFSTLQPEAQKIIAAKESQREKVVNEKMQEAAHFQRQFNDLATWAQTQVGTALATAEAAYLADFGQIDWLELQQTDPGLFLQLDAEKQKRQQYIGAVAKAKQQADYQQKQQQQSQYAAQLKSEAQAVLPKIQSIIGEGYNAGVFKKDVSEYLKGLGAPEGHINGIDHGYQLELAAKAMLYDRGQKTREQAAKKVAAAPKMQKTKASGSDGSNSKYDAALEKLRREPGNTDNIADALLALS